MNSEIYNKVVSSSAGRGGCFQFANPLPGSKPQTFERRIYGIRNTQRENVQLPPKEASGPCSEEFKNSPSS
jgi:hypothetical protein